MKASQLMTRTVFSVREGQNLNDAAQLMWEQDCGWIPVLDGDGKLQSTVTDRDIAMAAFLNGKPLIDIPVTRAQSHRLVTCKQDDDIGEVEKLMRTRQVRRVAVVGRGNKLVGVISLNDIALACRSGKKGVDAEGLSDTLAAICRHQQSTAETAAVA